MGVGKLLHRWHRVGTTLVTALVVMVVTGGAIGGLADAAAQRTNAAARAPIPVAEAPVEAPAPPAAAPTQVDELPRDRIDHTWAARTSARTGIPLRAFLAYAAASLQLKSETPGCGVSWNTLAGIGYIESGHASHGGARLLGSGHTDRPILGPVLDGRRTGLIRDSDRGRWDGDANYDRAIGPMQFIPGTWKRWGADADGDGVADPNQIDDAALAAARYLCASGSLRSTGGWRAAVLSYNHSEEYADRVAGAANDYAAKASA
ncbi:MAG: murein transglycosylase [Actinobacteria bacterium HGW-Actinobacteria-2]|nr:MAG: murein transglycosylase [Actinobacteria bacterium HGW-Actinobacteria-2]